MGGGRLVVCALAVMPLVACRGRFDLIDDPTGDGGATSGDGAGGGGDTMMVDAPAGTLVASFDLVTNTSPPTARRSCGAAIGNDDRVWIYGGFVGGVGASNTLAAYTPSTGAWATFTATGATPPTIERHTLAWDGASNVLVIFSGYSATLTHRNELYFYAPASNTLTQIPTAGTWPAARKDASMVWVPSQSAMLMYGGSNGAGAPNRFAELWRLSINVAGPSATWTLLTPGGVATPQLSAVCADYDPVARRLIVFGGQTTDNNTVQTTYQYLVDTDSWQLDTTTGTPPGARAFSGCAWDPGVNRLVVYGGQDNGGNPINGIFAYDPDAKVWSTLAPASGMSPPGACSDPGTAYSASLGGVYLFGGRTGGATYVNTSRLLDSLYE